MRTCNALLVVMLLVPSMGFAQSADSALHASVRSMVRLELSTTSVRFPDADPDAVPFVPALPGPVSITGKTRTRTGSTVVLTVQAADSLRSGVNTIQPSAITWTATGPGFVPGTLSRQAVTVATWVGSGVHTGTQALLFRNLWTHPVGTYSLTLQYTLTTP